MLATILGSPVQERPRNARADPSKSHKEDEGTGASDIGGETVREGPVQTGEANAQEYLVNI